MLRVESNIVLNARMTNAYFQDKSFL